MCWLSLITLCCFDACATPDVSRLAPLDTLEVSTSEPMPLGAEVVQVAEDEDDEDEQEVAELDVARLDFEPTSVLLAEIFELWLEDDESELAVSSSKLLHELIAASQSWRSAALEALNKWHSPFHIFSVKLKWSSCWPLMPPC